MNNQTQTIFRTCIKCTILSVIISFNIFCNNVADNSHPKALDSVPKVTAHRICTDTLFLNLCTGLSRYEYEIRLKELAKEGRIKYDTVPLYSFHFTHIIDTANDEEIFFKIQGLFVNDSLKTITLNFQDGHSDVSMMTYYGRNIFALYELKYGKAKVLQQRFSNTTYNIIHQWTNENKVIEIIENIKKENNSFSKSDITHLIQFRIVYTPFQIFLNNSQSTKNTNKEIIRKRQEKTEKTLKEI